MNQFNEAEITVFCGENARLNTKASFQQALEIINSGKGNVLYVNTVFTSRKLYAIAREVSGNHEHEGLFCRQVTMGDLHKYFTDFQELIEKENIKTIVINSWEFSNSGYLYKEKALFQLKHYADALGLSVLVYSQAAWTYETGKIARVGLGKLAVIADIILLVNEEQEHKVIMSNTRKINELSYARSESGISVGGELILPGKEVFEEEFSENELMEV
jgi:hypothetical protein